MNLGPFAKMHYGTGEYICGEELSIFVEALIIELQSNNNSRLLSIWGDVLGVLSRLGDFPSSASECGLLSVFSRKVSLGGLSPTVLVLGISSELPIVIVFLSTSIVSPTLAGKYA